MASEEIDLPGTSSSNGKAKRTRKSSAIPLDAGHRCIAAAMSKVINNMVNKQLQQHCKDLLQVEDIEAAEARIYYVLQQIDFKREEEQKIKEMAKKRIVNKKVTINK